MFLQKFGFFLFLSLWLTPKGAFSSIKIQSLNEPLKLQLEKQNFIQESASPQALKTEIKNFLIKQSYYTAEVQVNKQSININNPLKWEIFFNGNKKFSSHLLKTILSQSSFTPVSKTFITESLYVLNNFYKAQGFHFINITASQLKTPGPFIKRILFKVSENKKVKLSHIKIRGNYSPLREKKLVKLLKKYGGAPLSQGYFHEEALQRSLVNIRNDFKNQGFFNSKVTLSDLVFNKKKTSVKISLNINLNNPTIIKSLNFNGNKAVSSFWLKELLGLKKEKILNLYNLEEGLNLIEDYYLQRGFLNVQIEKEKILNYTENEKFAHINIKISEAEQIIISDIEILGLQKTKKYVVLNKLTFSPGEVLTLERIKSSNTNLQNLGIFSNIKITPLLTTVSRLGYKIQISLQERKSGTFVTGVGLNTELGLTFKTFAGLSYKNLWGAGHSFSSKIELKRNLREINYLENKIFLTYFEPYFITKNVDATFNLSRNDEIWDLDNSTSATHTVVTFINSHKFNLSLKTMLTQKTKLLFSVFSLDLRKERVSAFRKANQLGEFSSEIPEIQEIIGTFGPSIEIDYRNHLFLPSKGSFSKFSLEYGAPFLGSKTKFTLNNQDQNIDLNFLRLQTLHSFYKPLKKDLIFAQSFRAGYLYNFTKSFTSEGSIYTPFPKSKAFFLGGSSTIRGFDPSQGNERIPSDRNLQSVIEGNNIGGGLLSIPTSSHYYLTKSELRFPLSKKSNWWGALFYDAGSVQINSISLDPWRHAVGLGLRYNTPLGPLLNVELAYKLDRNAEFGESAYEFHLSVSSF